LSFILDALRKSEHERQRQAGPAIAEMPVSRPASRLPVALGVIGALLAVNLAVLLYFMLRGDATEVAQESPVLPPARPAPAVTATPVPTVSAAPPPATSVTVVPAPEARQTRPLRGETSAEEPAPPAHEAPGAPDPSLLPAPPAIPPPLPVARRMQPSGTVGQDDYLPRIDTLPAQATAGLPALNLDLHIYSPEPSQRAAFINGRRYREGDTTAEGVEVLAITTDGAVLRYRGQRFLLPRQ
jgi:general secretion pathway protein B